MTYNEAETRFYLIDSGLREKGYDDHQSPEFGSGNAEVGKMYSVNLNKGKNETI